MTPRNTVIEAMADRMINECTDSFQEMAAVALDALLATLPALGLRVVPVEATEEMIDTAIPMFLGDGGQWTDQELYQHEWQAMIAVSPDVLGSGG